MKSDFLSVTVMKALLTILLCVALLSPLALHAQDDAELLTRIAGTWSGKGGGEEVRFRAPNGVLTLTVRHEAEFFFHVAEDGTIKGEGTITYDLSNNTTGLDDIVAGIKAGIGMLPMPSGQGAVDPVAGAAVKTDAPGVTSIQYEAPHLKNGKELRRFSFTGMVDPDAGTMTMEVVKNFQAVDGTPDNTLYAAYEVNRKKEEKPFPTWSPFLEAPATLRKAPGDIWLAEFQEKGIHRNSVKVWQEYGYYWMARKEGK